MSSEDLAALRIKAPVADTALVIPTPELRFTSTNAGSLSNALPKTPVDWRGRWVDLKNESVVAGDIIGFHFSVGGSVSATIDAAAVGGAPTATRGRLLFPGERMRMRVPASTPQGADVFFNRTAAANTPNISMSLVE